MPGAEKKMKKAVAIVFAREGPEAHLQRGSAVINTTSVNAYTPNASLLPYTLTKAAIQNFTSTLAQLQGMKFSASSFSILLKNYFMASSITEDARDMMDNDRPREGR